ncbi:ion channel [Aestuariirhabdus sp. LZHN29]|uniref:ion channel n=1 Tax=Aestuariirhabdus sp. LZHN29 TaxID=3417462 RepID=UPI003CF1B2A8
MNKWVVFPRYGFGSLLAGMVLILTVASFSGSSFEERLLERISISLLLIASVYLLSRKRHMLVLAALFSIPTLVTNWAAVVYSHSWLQLADHVTNVIFFGYVTWCLLQQIFKAERVGTDTIMGSICIYLLLGFTWSFLYGALAVVQPGAFADMTAEQISTLVYFSFVTLSTLGYGDILPVTRQAQMLAYSEALTGQLYLAVLVARLVGLYRVK